MTEASTTPQAGNEPVSYFQWSDRFLPDILERYADTIERWGASEDQVAYVQRERLQIIETTDH